MHLSPERCRTIKSDKRGKQSLLKEGGKKRHPSLPLRKKKGRSPIPPEQKKRLPCYLFRKEA